MIRILPQLKSGLPQADSSNNAEPRYSA